MEKIYVIQLNLEEIRKDSRVDSTIAPSGPIVVRGVILNTGSLAIHPDDTHLLGLVKPISRKPIWKIFHKEFVIIMEKPIEI